MLIWKDIVVIINTGIFLVCFFFLINKGRRHHRSFGRDQRFGWKSWSGRSKCFVIFFFGGHFFLISNIFFLLVHWVESRERERDGGGARCHGQSVNINGHGDSVRVDA